MDGRLVKIPGDIFTPGTFPQGNLFAEISGVIKFEIPRPGIYRIDITSDENKIPSIYNYKIEVTNPPPPTPPGA